jgi:hypothetical protein
VTDVQGAGLGQFFVRPVRRRLASPNTGPTAAQGSPGTVPRDVSTRRVPVHTLVEPSATRRLGVDLHDDPRDHGLGHAGPGCRTGEVILSLIE